VLTNPQILHNATQAPQVLDSSLLQFNPRWEALTFISWVLETRRVHAEPELI
jgi:hypothetical protein